ncbi:TadE/TadG family type IV pilus assembly protein [Pseudahrensia aquimaris]|uniref:TadE/TadG family type IV pilus assembly protein n=1 Tax=Pseudahrensia aquimaris TaxID=744461 RepID=A0ABW3FLJ6_9HYPH
MEKQNKTPVKNRWQPFKRFRKSEDGATAVEFAMICAPFFMIVGSIFEFAVAYLVQGMLHHGAADVARLVRTNQITAGTHTEAQFKQVVCGLPYMGLFDCERLVVDLQTVAQFGAPGTPRNADGTLNTQNMSFSPGGPNSINVMRLYYEFPVLMAWMQGLGTDATPNGRLMTATQAFMIEP